jgi:hypothetical protein
MVLTFLNMVPDKLIGEPCGLPGSQRRVLAGRVMANREPVTALLTRHSRHDNRVRLALFILAQAFGRAIGSWLFVSESSRYHRGSRGWRA